tara:strand:+ start:26061 stop:26264 length:204 start_codon:yes stop_codon:yes gene_type:complete
MEESINLVDLYNELKKIEKSMVTKEELNQVMETITVLSNEDTVEQINLSNDDIREGRIREISSVAEI